MPVSGEWMVIGEVAGAFGVRGEIKVTPLTDHPGRFKRLKTVYLGPDHRQFDVTRVRPHKSHVLLTLAGISTPEEVRKLRGDEIAVPRSEAIELPEGHYFLEDVIGVPVETPDGRQIGRVAEVIRTGGNDVYVVNQGRNAILIPVVKDAVRELDLQTPRVVVETWVLDSDGS